MRPSGILSLIARVAVTAFAFWWALRLVDVESLKGILGAASPLWLLAALGVFSLSQAGCIYRWALLAPAHPSVRLPFLAESFLVAQFFNVFMPSTIGGDVIRGYDLIKATGEWKGSLASILMDRLIGFAGSALMASAALACFAPARQDPVVRTAFAAMWGLLAASAAVLGSRRVLRGMLTPFSKIGLGTLESHAKQFQEAIRSYLTDPRRMLGALGWTAVIQLTWILTFAAVARALHSSVPLLYLLVSVPLIMMIAQVPVSLNGWGVRESAAVFLLGRIGVPAAEALSLSLVCAVIPLVSGGVGAVLFLARRRKTRR
ncbi:MAG: flippase-like domain-containing protein [Candidatus Omnitrophica bacterium]|nr:flippase-like domain-containing protein [Candidatus Omnitrophota bacterium]